MDTLFFDKDCPLEAVVSLAEPRDVHGLNSAFLTILQEHISDRAVKVYEVINDFYSPTFKSSKCEPSLRLLIETQPDADMSDADLNEDDVQACIQNNTVVTGKSSFDDSERTIFPIPGLVKALGILVIEGRADQSCHNFLDPLLRIYSSHAFLLNRNEHDTLTGLYNRQALETKLCQIYHRDEIKQRKGDSKPVSWCLALLDLDHFKSVNDKFGHIYGDEVLIMFSQLLERCFRDDDMLFRYGGEEFVIVLKDVDITKAKSILNRFRKLVAETRFPQIGTMTASIGFCLLDTSQPIPVNIDNADRALYYSKNHGRNRISVYEELLEKGEITANKIEESNITVFPKQSVH
ncbi:MAG: GGDEF domain-containing protein [Gammaproteobacteria bacterium]|nr:GGDEF domain-containing protein [Gammaproteobacteria bacterium]